MKVLYATSEAYPFAQSGGLADVAYALPKALRRRLIGCRVILPLYDTIKQEFKDKMTFITNITVPVAWRRQYCGVFEAKLDGVIYYFIDNQYYFKRPSLYGFYDDAERYAFFSRAVIEILPHIDFKPDVIHCNDWQTSLVPVYLNAYYRENEFYRDIKTVITIHNIAYQGKYGYELLQDVVGIDEKYTGVVDYDGCVNFLKGGLQEADRITTVSPTYANEILDPYYAHGLDRILNELKGKLSGIVNGIDIDVYNPETDPLIYKNFTEETLSDKAFNKAELQKEMGLEVNENVALVGMVSRMVKHKGFDLVKHVFEEMLSENVQFVILGSGDWEFETFFYQMAEKYKGRVAVKLGFVPELAHKIYAGADIFLMPSQSEPCGLAQMVALKYGTIPIVRETGGLADTIKDSHNNLGNGFTFTNYNAHDMKFTLSRAVKGFNNKEGWEILTRRAMQCDNSWGASANKYIRLYKDILGKK